MWRARQCLFSNEQQKKRLRVTATCGTICRMKTLNIEKINRLLQTVPLKQVSEESGVALRSLQRMKSGHGNQSLSMLYQLALWAKTKR